MEIHTALLLLFVYAAKRLILRRVPPARAGCHAHRFAWACFKPRSVRGRDDRFRRSCQVVPVPGHRTWAGSSSRTVPFNLRKLKIAAHVVR